MKSSQSKYKYLVPKVFKAFWQLVTKSLCYFTANCHYNFFLARLAQKHSAEVVSITILLEITDEGYLSSYPI